MRKFLPLIFAACSYAGWVAAADPSANVDPVKQQPPANADAKGDANPGAPTASDNARPERRSADPAGAAQDSSQNAGAGGTSPKRDRRSEKQRGSGDTVNGPTPDRYSRQR